MFFPNTRVDYINWHNLPAEVATSPTLESNHSRPDLAVTSKTFCSCIHTLKQKPNLQYAEGGHLIKKEEEEENMCMQAWCPDHLNHSKAMRYLVKRSLPPVTISPTILN